MEMNRREFLKNSGIASFACAVFGISIFYLKSSGEFRKFLTADKKNIYPGKLRPMGTEIGSNGKWLG